MNKKATIFLVCFIVSFLVSLFLNFGKIKIPYFNGMYKAIQADVIFKNNPPKVFYDNEEIKTYLKIDKNHYLYNISEFKLIKKVKFENSKNIQKAMVYVGNDVQFLDKNQAEIQINNSKSFLDKLGISLLSLIYNSGFYVISYIFLILFLYNFKFDIRAKSVVISLFLLGFILRIVQINAISFWDDEIYVLTHTTQWLKTLQDPGNPPLYFIFFKLWRTVFQNPDFYRFSSVILGCLFNVCFYVYLKTNLGHKRALIGLFLVSVNIVLIYFSQELRAYMLLILLAVINSYFLFKFRNKTKIYYMISAILLLYTHFYAAFYVFYNFIFGCALFFKNKSKLKNFISVNVASFLVYLPLIIYKKASLLSDFNSWMDKPEFVDFIAMINIFSGKILSSVLFLILCGWVYKKLEKKLHKLFFAYNFIAIVCVFILALLFSYLIKPIFFYKYFYILFANYLVLLIMIVYSCSKVRFGKVLSVIFLVLFSITSRVNYQNLFCNHNLFIKYVQNNLDKTKNNYVFITDTVVGYKPFELEGVKTISLMVNKGIDTLDLKEYDFKRPAVIYAINLYLTNDSIEMVKKVDLFKSPLGVFFKIEL